MIGQALYAILSPGLAVHPLIVPQEASLPAVTYQLISMTRSHQFGGDSPIQIARMQLDSWADTYAEARSTADAVTAALNRFSGTAAGIAIADVLLDNEMEMYDDDGKARRVMQDYRVFYES